MTLLSLKNVTASYGPSQALFGVDLDIGEGEVVALMGRNGMGKSTTIKTICGMLPASEGTLHFSGNDLRKLPSHKIARLGIGLVPEGRRCFAPLTVEENLRAAARPGPWDFAMVADLFPRLAERRDQTASSLSGGEQQMLAIGRALMINPRLLILDEATEGLAPVVRQEIWAAIARLKRDSGLSILVVDKTLRELSAVADRAVIVNKGATVWTGTMGALTPELKDRYLGV
ncbi:ABC transporter ATP-binding protein [Phaeobacter gallaeciensis]|uniref:Branched-chain amino acid transporter, ATP-binding protein n=1 Tax=Phaeobacter gallaeciensis TaxID=60890 RepID=A0AAC9Z8G9_9RHOB|nr:ABC transporter ATP-binding protein [Phaeobacter gallaeciensis]AHD09447.1 amino acid/amide ABC transporter ATP-binding protein 2, HAAT family [Phaeobacter gallaeciensis DSM 26640]ATE92710.1 putative branched-chain amino acid transporter, ATP-binding protein [Phaeobacter gallaeciensis]ATE97468.1 putative branched-chain amino acid transporter, ATP-binding protein [Phaeobacter gallaeciensis]ATF01375.1 putative branched-chain amino acid transporter, ATP-binding protein [Phaeobacter gallaeciensis